MHTDPYRVERRGGWRRFVPLAVVLTISAAVFVVVAVLVLLLNQPENQPLTVTVVLDGEAFPVQTYAATVAALLAELDIRLNEGDTVSPSPQTTITPNLLIRIDRAHSVTLLIDGRPTVIQTTLNNPAEILAERGILINEVDQVLVDGTQAELQQLERWTVPATTITVNHAIPVHIVDDGGPPQTILTTEDTVGDALFAAGITLYLADSVTPDLSAPVTADMTVNVRRSQPLSIVVDGVTLESRTSGTTVADALIDAGVVLVGLDYAIPDEDTSVRPGMFIRIIRVTEDVLIEQESVPFETVYEADADRELDQRDVSQEGRTGVRQTFIRVRYENGIEISRRTIRDGVVVQPPVNRVISYGTQVVLRTVETPDGPRQYWRRLRMYATSYHPAALGGDDVTATGARLTLGIVASDPDVIPYDTQIFVPGYGVGLMADTGGPRSSPMWIDLGYDDSNFRSWSRFVDVYLLTPVPGEIDYLLPE